MNGVKIDMTASRRLLFAAGVTLICAGVGGYTSYKWSKNAHVGETKMGAKEAEISKEKPKLTVVPKRIEETKVLEERKEGDRTITKYKDGRIVIEEKEKMTVKFPDGSELVLKGKGSGSGGTAIKDKWDKLEIK
jgi:hypothetical protein